MTLRYAALGTGAGRPHGRPKGVQHVEDTACPNGSNHVLVNSAQQGGLVTACRGCGRSWSELDAALRGRS